MRQSFFDPELLAYMTQRSVPELPVMAELRTRTAELGTPARMQIDPYQGQVMMFLMQLIGARRILEIGTFTGMSALWLARALPDGGELHCCDINGEWTDIARDAWRAAGLENRIHLHLAPALETIAKFTDGGFDAVFIDADVRNRSHYLDAAHRLLRVGGLAMLDNSLWRGEVANLQCDDKWVAFMRETNDKLAADVRFHSVILPVGDGLSLAVKR